MVIAPAMPNTIELTPEQQGALDQVLLAARTAGGHCVVSLCGYAGTGNKGAECASAAIEMITLVSTLPGRASS